MRPSEKARDLIRAEGLVEGKTVSIDATTLEANAALRTLVRWDNGQKYDDYLKDLAKAAGIENPTREQLAPLCPYQAISYVEVNKKAEINEVLCKGCGTCVAACPSGSIEQKSVRGRRDLRGD